MNSTATWSYDNCEDNLLSDSLFLNQSIDDLQNSSLWKRLCPFLTILESVSECKTNKVVIDVPDLRMKSTSNALELNTKGFYKMSAVDTGLPEMICEYLAMGILRLRAHGYSTNMIMMFDEAWIVGDLLNTLVGVTSGNSPIGDWFVFHVDSKCSPYIPGPPHRDRPTADNTSFRNNHDEKSVILASSSIIDVKIDTNPSLSLAILPLSDNSSQSTITPLASPKYCSVWLALTDATPENSCLYLIPKDHDPGYGFAGDNVVGMGHVWGNILAQPLLQGGALTFSHRLLHWGSQPQPHAGRGRIALSLAFADPTFEVAYFDHAMYGPLPPMMLRLGLVAGQQIQYEHLAPLNMELLGIYRRIFHQSKQFFSLIYYEKISNASQFLVFKMKQQKKKR